LFLGACAAVALGGSLAGTRAFADPAAVAGASPDTCFDCKDMRCDWCPPPAPCVEEHGYCTETVRNLSQFCAPRIGGDWERCKWRVDREGACVVQLLNPCTRERPVCTTEIKSCGPLGVCIPEGVCIP
jgi:hypothetical protein